MEDGMVCDIYIVNCLGGYCRVFVVLKRAASSEAIMMMMVVAMVIDGDGIV